MKDGKPVDVAAALSWCACGGALMTRLCYG